jgi:hypothetical protein
MAGTGLANAAMEIPIASTDDLRPFPIQSTRSFWFRLDDSSWLLATEMAEEED